MAASVPAAANRVSSPACVPRPGLGLWGRGTEDVGCGAVAVGAAPGCRQGELHIRHHGLGAGAGARVALGTGAAASPARSPLSPLRWQPRGAQWVLHWGLRLLGYWELLPLVPVPAAVSAGEEEVVRSPDAFLALIALLLLLLLLVKKQWRGCQGGLCGGVQAQQRGLQRDSDGSCRVVGLQTIASLLSARGAFPWGTRGWALSPGLGTPKHPPGQVCSP